MLQETTAFIFDMDGTIVDNLKFHIRAWREFLMKHGIELSEAEIYRHNHGTIDEVVRHFFGTNMAGDEIIRLGSDKELYYRDLYRPYLQPIAGLKTFLDRTQQLNIPMALATSAGKANIDFILDGLEIRSYFKAIVGGDDVHQGKPHPETFLTTAQKLNLPPELCWVFEDTLSGIEAARNAGMKAIAVATTLSVRDVEKFPVVRQVIRDYTTLKPESLLQV